ncbi:hypothetical protein FBU31_008163, partial [Coemansia sp. 'formosensis']
MSADSEQNTADAKQTPETVLIAALKQQLLRTETAERRRLLRVLITGSLIRLIILVMFPDLVSHYLAGRVELTTPVTSYKRLVEGVHLSLHNASPYDGGLFHQSPLLLILFRVLHVLPDLFTNIVYVAVDAMIALTLAKLAAVKSDKGKNNSGSRVPGEIRFVCTPSAIATMYLFNPLTVATTLAKSTIVFSHLAIVSALYAGISGLANQAIMFTAVAAHLSLYPAVLIAPIALMAAVYTKQSQHRWL